MKHYVSNKKESIRYFDNPFFEWFSHIHPITPLLFFGPLLIFVLYEGFYGQPFGWAALTFLIGLLNWTLLEYCLHRFIFHLKLKSKLGNRIVYVMHTYHHDYPRDPDRLVMPLAFSIPLSALIYYLYSVIFQTFAISAFAGMVLGYLLYDYSHFCAHHFKMEKPILSFIKQYHLNHHYTNPHHGYGVSNPLWDHIFRTYPRKIKNSPKTTP
jgi:sterol desaturase/sphingolipid hydroxylase (fatty acid hydroxylase superfamily)